METALALPETLKSKFSPEVLKEALAEVMKLKEKQEAKAKAKRAKKELTPEQIKAQQLKEARKAVAQHLGVKVATKTFGSVKRTHGRGQLKDEDILEYAHRNGYTQAFLHKGKVSATVWATIKFDFANTRYIWNGQTFTSLYALHKAFATGNTFGVLSTLKSVYLAKDGEEPSRNAKARLLYTLNSEWVSYTPVKERSVASGSVKGKDEPEPEADEENGHCGNCECELTPETHIFCLAKATGEELTLCQECWTDMKDVWKAEGWKCDDDETEEAPPAPAPAPVIIKKGKAKVKKISPEELARLKAKAEAEGDE